MTPKKIKTDGLGAKSHLAIPPACSDEKAAVEFMEDLCWGDSPCCPRCGSLNIYQMRDGTTGGRQANFRWLCRDCKSAKDTCQFTVRTGTVFEDSRAELRHWCYAFWRAATSENGVSALEIHQHTGLSYKSSLFMLQRIRFAIDSSSASRVSGNIEVDETSVKDKSSGGGESERMGKNQSPGVVAKNAENAAVLDVSWKILKYFIERKSSAFTVKELAEVATISERTFYRYFPRKEDVVRPIFAANALSLVESFSERPHSESIANSLIAAFDQSWWANHPEQARTIRYIMYESSELRAVWLQVIIDLEIILSEALAVRLEVAPNSRQASLAATVVSAAIRNAFSDFSDADPTETLTESFAHNIAIVGPQIFKP
ncbi:MAG: transposase [Verrucomicrobiaceae bacterium]|nr:transposase [Verrucomicrobiaceae bacterium]